MHKERSNRISLQSNDISIFIITFLNELPWKIVQSSKKGHMLLLYFCSNLSCDYSTAFDIGILWRMMYIHHHDVVGDPAYSIYLVSFVWSSGDSKLPVNICVLSFPKLWLRLTTVANYLLLKRTFVSVALDIFIGIDQYIYKYRSCI